MVQITAKIDGLGQLRAALGAMGAQMEAEIDDAVNATGLELRGDIIKRYARPPTSGKFYQKYKPRRTHKASAPGEAPQTDTGRLAAGTVFRKAGHASVVVENRVKYARTLEYGSRDGRILPRPAWRPAALKAEKSLTRRVKAAVERATR